MSDGGVSVDVSYIFVWKCRPIRQGSKTIVNTLLFQRELQKWVWNTWDKHPPKWFITLLWRKYPDFIQVEENMRHFKNVFYAKAYSLNSPRKIPRFPYRMGMTAFHERKTIYLKDGIVKPDVFHTHIHLYGSNNAPLLWDSDEFWKLDWFIRKQVAPNCDLLLKTTKKGNDGIVVKPWMRQRHFHYNFKDYRKYRYCQDGDLVLDKYSDLLSNRRNVCYR